METQLEPSSTLWVELAATHRLNQSQTLNWKELPDRFNHQGFSRMLVKGQFLSVCPLAEVT